MPYFAKLDEAFTDQRESRRHRGSNSSSSSLRMKRSPMRAENECGEFNENYRIESPIRESPPKDSECEAPDYCLSLVNQVLQNNWCKKILRNILLEEYMDNYLQHKIETVNAHANANYREPHTYTCDNQSGGNMDFLPSGQIWGLDLRTLSILGLVILGGLYFYDFFHRLFR